MRPMTTISMEAKLVTVRAGDERATARPSSKSHKRCPRSCTSFVLQSFPHRPTELITRGRFLSDRRRIANRHRANSDSPVRRSRPRPRPRRGLLRKRPKRRPAILFARTTGCGRRRPEENRQGAKDSQGRQEREKSRENLLLASLALLASWRFFSPPRV
jgi:hypothetical protein